MILKVLFLCFLVFISKGVKSDEEVETVAAETITTNDIPNVDESESLLSHVVSDVNKTLTNLYNHVTSANVTAENTTQSANETRKLVKCKEIVYDQSNGVVTPTVEIINGSYLSKLLQVKPDITSRDMEADCVIVLFFARACPFSAHAAPHYNALARLYPNIKMVALDALKHHGINAQYGIVGVPTLKMFHNGRPVGKFNGTEYKLQSFCQFIFAITEIYPFGRMMVTSQDFQGPVSSVVVNETDYFLVLSWLFIVTCAVYYFAQSNWCKMIVDVIRNNWRESEAQHEHND